MLPFAVVVKQTRLFFELRGAPSTGFTGGTLTRRLPRAGRVGFSATERMSALLGRLSEGFDRAAPGGPLGVPHWCESASLDSVVPESKEHRLITSGPP